MYIFQCMETPQAWEGAQFMFYQMTFQQQTCMYGRKQLESSSSGKILHLCSHKRRQILELTLQIVMVHPQFVGLIRGVI